MLYGPNEVVIPTADAFYCNAYFNGMYEDGNQLRVNLKFPSCERMWNFVVQFVSVV